MNRSLRDTGPEDKHKRNARQRQTERPASSGSWRGVASGIGAAVAAVLAATLAVTGGAGEQDARTSFVLEAQVRYVAEFTGAQVSTQARPPGAPIPVSAYVAPPFIWPAEGPVTSYMGASHPLGIDIGLSTERSREIKAAAAGTVTFSGGTDDNSYGYHIVIDHGGGVETLYGHLSQRIVQAGAIVQQGQLIGIGGSSGKSDGMHLHFEVTKNGNVFDPLKLLPEEPNLTDALNVACQAEALTIDAGTRVTLDLAGATDPGETITGIGIEGADGAPVDASVLDAEAKGPAVLDLWTGLAFEGPVSDDAYVVTISTVHGGRPAQTIECEVNVHTPRIQPSYYMPRSSTQAVAQATTATSTATATPMVVATLPADFPSGLATFTPVPPTPIATATPSASATPTKAVGTSTPAPSATPMGTPAP